MEGCRGVDGVGRVERRCGEAWCCVWWVAGKAVKDSGGVPHVVRWAGPLHPCLSLGALGPAPKGQK
jgi:hypothetical protein